MRLQRCSRRSPSSWERPCSAVKSFRLPRSKVLGDAVGRELRRSRLRRLALLELTAEHFTHLTEREEVRVDQCEHAVLIHLAKLVAPHVAQLVLIDHSEPAIDEGL